MLLDWTRFEESHIWDVFRGDFLFEEARERRSCKKQRVDAGSLYLVRGASEGLEVGIVPQAAHDEGDDQDLADLETRPDLVAAFFEPAGHEEAELLAPGDVPDALFEQEVLFLLGGFRQALEKVHDAREEVLLGGVDEVLA